MSFFLEEKRSRDRRRSIYYLKVTDVDTGDALARLVDISDEGLMVISPEPMKKGDLHTVELTVEEAEQSVRCHVEIRWCRPDANPSLYKSGLHVLDPDDGFLELARLIKAHYSIESFRVEDETA